MIYYLNQNNGLRTLKQLIFEVEVFLYDILNLNEKGLIAINKLYTRLIDANHSASNAHNKPELTLLETIK